MSNIIKKTLTVGADGKISANGGTTVIYPKTTADQVEGLEDIAGGKLYRHNFEIRWLVQDGIGGFSPSTYVDIISRSSTPLTINDVDTVTRNYWRALNPAITSSRVNGIGYIFYTISSNVVTYKCAGTFYDQTTGKNFFTEGDIVLVTGVSDVVTEV